MSFSISNDWYKSKGRRRRGRIDLYWEEREEGEEEEEEEGGEEEDDEDEELRLPE